jgi:ABC-type glycerol-3-phosphate transport system permease component
MTRAVDLMLLGQGRASLHMHPLAVPMLLAGGAFALSTVWTTYVFGLPLVHRSRLGRAALGALAVVYVASFVLWGLRFAGWFGGPVPV